MNNSSKNRTWLFRFLVFAVLFIPTYLALYNIYVISSNNPTMQNITKIGIVRTEDNYTAEYTDSNKIKIFINALNNAKSGITPRADIDGEKPIMLTFYKGAEEIKYDLYLSSNDKDCLLKDANGDFMLIKSKDADTLLNSEIADTVYEFSKIPQASIQQGQENKFLYPNSGEWYIKKPGGEFQLSTVANSPAQTELKNNARIFKNKPMNLTFTLQPDNINIKIYDNKEEIFNGAYSKFQETFGFDVNKSLQFIVDAEWYKTDTSDYYGTAEYNIDISYEVPVDYRLSETEANAGDILILTAYNMGGSSENYTVEVSDPADTGNTGNTENAENTGRNIIYSTKFSTADGKQIALVPIGIDFAGKTINVTISGGETPVNYQIKVANLSGTTQSISANDEMMRNNLSPSAIANKKSEYDKILAVSDNFASKYWDGSFTHPREGSKKEWLKYGDKVSINGGTYSYINPASNLDVNPKDPILATNSGKVIYAGKIPDDGNLVVIDHGMGIKSWYGHLDEIKVKAGDDISKGQQIGTAGNSGLYTTIKYNLYFAVSIKDIFINPMWIIKNGIAGSDLPSAIDSTASIDIPSIAPEIDTGETASPTGGN